MSAPEKCRACKERVVCVDVLCGPCWRLRAIALSEQIGRLVVTPVNDDEVF